jgi:hypothetical protein
MDLFWYLVILGVFFLGVRAEWMTSVVLNLLIYHEAWKENGSPDWGQEAVWMIVGAFAFFYFWAVIWILYLQ